MSVYIENETNKDIPKRYEEIVNEIVDAAIDYVHCPYECEINVIFTDNEGIRIINKDFRDIDAPTDVLSFPMIEYEFSEDFSKLEDESVDCFNQDNGELLLGDIILNIDRIKSQSEEFNHSIYRELAFLTAHSMLHLFGHDHIDEAQRIIMEEKQEEILNMKGYTRDYEEK